MLGDKSSPSLDPGDLSAGHDKVVLPEMVYDGVEEARMDALRPHAPLYLAELKAASAEEKATRNQRPLTSDFPDAETFLSWRDENPPPIERVQRAWDARLGFVSQNNLHVIFTVRLSRKRAPRTDVIQHYVGQLEEEDPQFVAACRIVAQASIASLNHQLELAHIDQHLSSEEVVEATLTSWNRDAYMTEVVERLQRLGASEEEINRLRN